MELTTDAVGGLLLVAMLIGVVAIALSVTALTGQRRVRAAYRAFTHDSREDVLTLLHRHIEAVDGLRGDVARLEACSDELRDLLRSSLSRVGTVRYDAFEELGGRLSFSSALLDEHGDGVVITAINGRTDTRVYAKPVVSGKSRHNLSEEEAEAIRRGLAMTGRTVATTTNGGGGSGAGARGRRPAPSR